MRLIIIAIIYVLSIGIIHTSAIAQTSVDTIDISQSALEDRHLRYMYNYALNAALFQSKGELSHNSIPENWPKTDNNSILVIAEQIQLKMHELETFVRPCAICYLNYIAHSHKIALEQPLRTQYQLEYHPPIELNDEDVKKKMGDILKDSENSMYYVAFSGLSQNREYFYLKMTLGFYVVYPELVYSISSIYEFRWCEARKRIYPIRIAPTLFDFRLIKVNSIRC